MLFIRPETVYYVKGAIIIRHKDLYTNLGLIATVPLSKVAYFILNRPVESAFIVAIPLDNYIPLIPFFILPYLLWYPFVVGSLFYLVWRDRPGFFRLLLGAHISLILCYGVYFFYQSTMPRPELLPLDVFSRMLNFIWAIDPPFNCFPSIHALWCVLIAWAAGKSSAVPKSHRYAFYIASGLIISSTMFTKQHGIIDALGAGVLGAGILYCLEALNLPQKWLAKKLPA